MTVVVVVRFGCECEIGGGREVEQALKLEVMRL